MKPSSSSTFLDALRRGERSSVAALYEESFPKISGYIQRNSGNEEQARDIFQDAMVVFFQKLQRPDFDLTAAPGTFLFAICRNLWLKKLKNSDRERVTNTEEMVSTLDEPDSEVWEEEARRQLFRRKFLELGKGCQELLKLSLKGVRVSEIVRQLGLSSEGYARKKKFKCKAQLVRAIQEDPGYAPLRYEH